MNTKSGKFSIIVIAAAVIASLAFGTQVAFAAPAMMTCPNDGWNTMGACTSDADCQSLCDGVHGVGNSIGHCRAGCCTCLW